MNRIDLIRQRTRRQQRAAGQPVYLAPTEVLGIRQELLAGVPVPELAERYGVSPRRIIRSAKGTALSDRSSLLQTQREMHERRAQARVGYERRCSVCQARYVVKWRGSGQATCSRSCGGLASQRSRP